MAFHPHISKRAGFAAAPKRQVNKLPLNMKRLLRDYMDGNRLKELPPEFVYRPNQSLCWTNAGYPIEYRYTPTSEKHQVDNYTCYSGKKCQSVVVASWRLSHRICGYCSRLKRLNRYPAMERCWCSRPCPIVKVFGHAEHDGRIKAQYKSKTIIDSLQPQGIRQYCRIARMWAVGAHRQFQR
jgi:hypothetical protein